MARPELLLMPNIPKPLHGIAPRVIFGQEWWDTERRRTYAAAGFKCEACGVAKEDAMFHPWLEAHERYEIDYRKGRMVFVGLVALCHACHNYIHSGRLQMLYDSGEISAGKFNAITAHGKKLLKKHGLKKPPGPKVAAEWGEWRMVYDGKEYGPSSDSYEDWADGAWRNWSPR